MTGEPDKPQRFRAPDDLWDEFGRAAKMVDSDRSKLLRQFMTYFVHRSNGRFPKRPAGPPTTDSED